MTLQQIKTKYKVTPHDGKYLLFDPKENSCTRFVYKYLACIEFNKGKANVVGFPQTTSLSVLEKQVAEYTQSLPFDSGYYNPMLREGLMVEMVIYDYMESIGFVLDNGYDGCGGWILKEKDVYGSSLMDKPITFRNLKNGFLRLDPTIDVSINLWLGGCEWVSVKTKRDPQAIIDGINGLLKPYLLSSGIKMVQTSDKMYNVGVDVMLNRLKDLDTISTEYRAELKEKLLKLVDTL